VLGFLCLALAVWYVFETRNFAITSFGSGPVGPKTMPTLVGILFAGLALVLILKPDESPSWGSFAVWSRLAAIVATSFLFGQLLEPLGFIVASTLLAVVIGLFFKGPVTKLVPLSLVFAIVVAFIFNNWLELRLPTGLWGGF
jgi:putative tricarboxylic transport membrane protein